MKRKAFTLIELLIVIAIIAILATIIIVALSNARPKANRAAALQSINTSLRTAQICSTESIALNTSPTYNGYVCSIATNHNARWPVQYYPSGTDATSGYNFRPTVTATGVTAVTVVNPTGAPDYNITCPKPAGMDIVTQCVAE